MEGMQLFYLSLGAAMKMELCFQIGMHSTSAEVKNDCSSGGSNLVARIIYVSRSLLSRNC